MQVTYPDSTFETTGYDALERVTSRTDANGKATQCVSLQKTPSES
jgi:YD repeat-containing protein